MKKMLLFLISITFLFGCNQEEFSTSRETLKDSSEEGIKLYAQKELSMQTRGVAVNGKLWENGQTIRIKFLNGTVTQQEKVKTFAQEWLQYANLTFDFVEQAENAEVKIAFDWQDDHITWSMIGTDARYIPQSAPSLNFGNLSKIDKLIRRDVLMQFGHVLGLVNEHQGVNNPLELDTELVYEYYLEEGWAARDINEFFFRPYTSAETNYTEYDSKSIMVWPIDPILTTNGVGQFQNSELSVLDKQFIAKLYPRINDTDYTVLGVSSSASFTVNLKKALNTTQDVFIDFGDGENYTGSGTLIPDHVYQAGSYEIKIDADRIFLNFGIQGPIGLSEARYLKSVKLNATTEYVHILLGGRASELNSINCDSLQAPLLLQTQFKYTFAYTKLKEIPENLFANCAEATIFDYCFYDIPSLNTIPENLFYNNRRARSFEACFSGSTSITSIPEKLFKNNPGVTNLYGCFSGFTSITSIPEKLFESNPEVTSFQSCFSSCNSLISIPENLFENNPKVTTFQSCFSRCTSLTDIPEKLFWNNPKVTTYYGCFENCTSITSIPENLFQNNLSVSKFEKCFANCSSLISIPERLFWNNSGAAYFEQCFAGTPIANIPENLFQRNVRAKSFSGCFYDCASLKSIPENLFQNNPQTTHFGSCFNKCVSLTHIPENLFSNNPEVEQFNSSFSGCTSLTSIPENLFQHNLKVIYFRECFSSCINLTGEAPALWERTNVVTFVECFKGAVNLSNYDQIPADWK